MSNDILSRALPIFETLVGFDTTSRRSNLDLIDWVESYLADHGVTGERVPNEEGDKANFYATVGPPVEGGVILSGHSDVVPVDGQDWSSDPFALTEKNGRYYGRGTSDMKGFIALALAGVPDFVNGQRPVHLAISYDEEVGCKGAPDMIACIAEKVPPPEAAIIGEPSSMRPISGHKGICVHEVTVTGHEAHSSQTQLGLSANMVAIELMHRLADLSRSLYQSPNADDRFTPPHATLTVGLIKGGTAANILARKCRFLFDLRYPPGEDADAALAPFLAECETLSKEMAEAFPGTRIKVVHQSGSPPLVPEDNGAAEALARRLTGANGPAEAAAYAAEAGQFQQAGFSTVICGPGDIAQAHQPDEFIEKSQMEEGAAFMRRLAEYLRG